jgi:transmembrane sensor
MNSNINKEYIYSYFSGNSSALQKQMIDEWVKEPENEELFYKWLVEFENQNPQYLTDVSKGFEHFEVYAHTHQATPTIDLPSLLESTIIPKRSFKTLWRIAASVLIGSVIGSWIFKDSIIYQTYDTGFGETKAFTLSDKTVITLNANSSLRVPRFGFGTKSREVFLTGEANFSVTHRIDNQKFTVKANKGLEVVVFGTEFTVYARDKTSKVVLTKGKVQLRYLENNKPQQVNMKPGDLVIFDEINHPKKEVTTQPEKYAAWKDHRFIFEDTTLEEFASIMQENYGIKVIVKDSTLANRTLVGSFRADNAEELLQIVSEVFNVNINRTDNTVVMTDN